MSTALQTTINKMERAGRATRRRVIRQNAKDGSRRFTMRMVRPQIDISDENDLEHSDLAIGYLKSLIRRERNLARHRSSLYMPARHMALLECMGWELTNRKRVRAEQFAALSDTDRALLSTLSDFQEHPQDKEGVYA